jgi:hypothetical protein
MSCTPLEGRRDSEALLRFADRLLLYLINFSTKKSGSPFLLPKPKESLPLMKFYQY